MSNNVLPISFWMSLTLFVVLCIHAWNHRTKAWGIPAVGVLATVMAWYHLDVILNDYSVYAIQFSPQVLDSAWWQLVGFAVSFMILVPIVHGLLNSQSVNQSSRMTAFLRGRDSLTRIQKLLRPAFRAAATIWIAVSIIALIRTGFDWQGLFFPWLGHKANPWSRGRIGSGFDFLISLILYVNIFCLSVFGLVATLANNRRLRNTAILFVFLSWPYVMIDRTRSIMLAVALPAILSYVFLRLSRRPFAQFALIIVAFLVIEGWMHHVFATRSHAARGGVASNVEEPRHLGLNMYEELCWINTFLDNGTYVPDGGKRYFAEAVNPIPRSLWRNKPEIGIDYAIARGQGGGSSSQGGVHATISTGMIGQGLVNFGIWLGPIAAAFLMSIWVGILARFDLKADHAGGILLYILGLVLTFNLGRDITLLTMYPLIFGYLIVRMMTPSTERTLQNECTGQSLPSR
jgi:hypothetical protein